MDNDVVITAFARTPIGNMQGALHTVSASVLGAVSIQSCLQQMDLNYALIDEVYMGCVLSAGQGQAPARQAAIASGIPNTVACTTVNKMCGSGMKSVMLGTDSIRANSNQIVVAGGFENMSQAPYLLPGARGGFRAGHTKCLDHMFIDGLEDAYSQSTSMGVFADNTAKRFNFSRQMQDEFAIASLTRVQHATKTGIFAKEIAPVEVTTRKGVVSITKDENPEKANIEKIPQLRAAFSPEGTVTAANASSISDGAASLVLMSAQQAKDLGVTPLARIKAHSSYAHEPGWFTTAPINAIGSLLKTCGWGVDDVDLFEINEAFAVVTMACMHELKISHEKVNIHGGACALGHPIGASGARILVTLLNALQHYGLKRGVASLCIGGGEATAMAIERID